MSSPAHTYPCPACGAPATLTSGCPGCRRPPDPAAAEVIRLNGEITELGARVEQARQTHLTLLHSLREAQLRRNELAAQIRVAPGRPGPGLPVQAAPPGPVGPPVPPSPVGLAVSPGTVGPGARPPVALAPAPPASAAQNPAVRPEASTRIVQNLLFVLGGLLLGSAAIVFTAVAWATFGVTGRAGILAAVTVLALAAPLLALRRQLTATAETFASVGLLLVLLDGYAAWSVDLFGVAGWPGPRYAALVAAATLAVSVGYGTVTRLWSPRFAALIAAQPVLPLLAVDLELGPFGWAFVFAAVAALNMAAVRMIRGDRKATALRIATWTAYGLALLTAGACGLVALATGANTVPVLLIGSPLVVAALLLVAAAMLARSTGLQAVAGAALVVALVVAVIRPISLLRPSFLLVGIAVVVTLAAIAVKASARLLPEQVRLGPRIGGLLVVGVAAQVVAVLASLVALTSAVWALPPWRTDLETILRPFDWQIPTAVALVTAALVVLLPTTAREPAAVVGGAFVVLAAPAAVVWPWWVTSAVEMPVAALLLLAAAGRFRAAGNAAILVRAGVALLLGGHALLVSLARAEAATAVLAAITLTGLVVAFVAARPPESDSIRRAIGGVTLVVGMLAGPATVAAGLLAVDVAPWWVARAELAAAALLVPALVAVRRWWPAYLSYAGSALVVAVELVVLLLPLVVRSEPGVVYAGIGVLLLTIGAVLLRPQPRSSGGIFSLLVAGGVLLLLRCVAVLPAVGTLLIGPYGWLGAAWSGAPDGVGLTPNSAPVVGWPAAVTLLLLAMTAAPIVWRWRGAARAVVLVPLPVGAVALLAVLAAARAPWPTVPVVSLVVGVAALLAGAVAPARQRSRAGAAAEHDQPPGPAVPFTLPAEAAPVAVPLGLVLGLAGMAGCLPAKASTLVALGLVVLASAVAGAVGRNLGVRIVGWLTTVVAGLGLALVAVLAAELPLRAGAFLVLGVAAVALAIGAALRVRRPVESAVVEVASHAGAVVALLLSAGHLRYAAAVCTLWGVAVGLRALRPGESSRRRWILAAVAVLSELVAAWLLLAAGRVAVLEAYTLPAAVLVLLAGWWALRSRPELSSWVGYGPGLAAALLPSLVSILAAPGQPWRRLLLGVGALAVVLAGAVWRRQAPVLLGGVTLVVVTLHEIAELWDRWQRWIFLAVGGLVLISLAMTYERRRRDLARLREAVGRMR
ncbi:MAG TPA: hypothetical protein VFX61_10445 [Micromonosporaceae bacterium]|nr:hypothetical protein [Micromonosporaceae bacterium]